MIRAKAVREGVKVRNDPPPYGPYYPSRCILYKRSRSDLGLANLDSQPRMTPVDDQS